MQALLDSLKKDGKITGKTVGHSAVQMAQMMLFGHVKFGVVSVEINSLMDEVRCRRAQAGQNLIATAK
jgi:hypothetical protein